jgi:hypothetical protein
MKFYLNLWLCPFKELQGEIAKHLQPMKVNIQVSGGKRWLCLLLLLTNLLSRVKKK